MSRPPSEPPAAKNGLTALSATMNWLTMNSKRPLKWYSPAKCAKKCSGKTCCNIKKLMSTAPTVTISMCWMQLPNRTDDSVNFISFITLAKLVAHESLQWAHYAPHEFVALFNELSSLNLLLFQLWLNYSYLFVGFHKFQYSAHNFVNFLLILVLNPVLLL